MSKQQILNFTFYLVGGAVRDKLLELPIKDKDWVVTGETIGAMQERGFTPVGKTFPVFLHPNTKEEYALARKEVKISKGYTGFDCISDPSITIEEDLLRRDLTINAIAQKQNGELIDPYNGLTDIKNRVLRHVSPAFTEDPLRVLRVARFHARFFNLGFTLAPETLKLMKKITAQGELNTLSAERIWQETEKALLTDNPEYFFKTLKACGALAILYPEIDALYGIEQRAEYHPEIDCAVHTYLSLQKSVELSSQLNTKDKISVRFAALTHDLGKALTPKHVLPSHRGHEHTGVPLVKALCQRLKTPNQTANLALLCCEFHLQAHTAFELRAQTIFKLFKRLDLFRQPEKLQLFLLCCQADSQGRTGFENRPYPQANYLIQCFSACQAISKKDINQNITGKAIGEAIDSLRITAIKMIKKTQTNNQ